MIEEKIEPKEKIETCRHPRLVRYPDTLGDFCECWICGALFADDPTAPEIRPYGFSGKERN